MKYFLLVPVTLVFCLWIYFCFWFLPKNLRTTHIGEKVGPIIERFTGVFFVATGFCSIILSLVMIFAPRFSYLSLIAQKVKFIIYTYTPVVIGIGFFLLLALVIVLKTLQHFRIIR